MPTLTNVLAGDRDLHNVCCYNSYCCQCMRNGQQASACGSAGSPTHRSTTAFVSKYGDQMCFPAADLTPHKGQLYGYPNFLSKDPSERRNQVNFRRKFVRDCGISDPKIVEYMMKIYVAGGSGKSNKLDQWWAKVSVCGCHLTPLAVRDGKLDPLTENCVVSATYLNE